MKTAIIRSSWMPGYGYRMDCQPYLGGALETKILLEKLPIRKDKLHTITSGFDGGIYNGPKFSRTWVESLEYGVPFLGSSAMLRADLTGLPLLSKKRAFSRQLRHLKLEPGMSLISCSGTIGNMVYSRRDMAGVWSSQHILKVQADPAKTLSGFLYAFLASKYGVPLIVSGTYGSIIQSLGPGNIVDTPVPRLGEKVERKIHNLIEDASELFSKHTEQLSHATNQFFSSVGLKDITPQEWHRRKSLDLGFGVNLPGPFSFRAINYAPRFTMLCDRMRSVTSIALKELCTPGQLSRGGRFNRIESDPDFGVRLIGQRELFALKPEGRFVARASVPHDAFFEDGAIAVAARGTLGEGELYCRAQFISGPWTKFVYSEDILRIVADERKMLRGCLFAFMRSETAFRMLRAISSGLNMQENHYYLLPRLPIPLPKKSDQERVNDLVLSAIQNRHEAVAKETQAIALVEKAIGSYGVE